MLLPITLTITGAAALLGIWLGGRTSRMRVVHKVSIGDGGVEPLVRRMRAHSNFVEYSPFFLILMALVELAEGPRLWLWAVGIIFILARILHGFGMDRPPGNKFRMVGMIVSTLCLLGLALYAIALPYLKSAPVSTITYASSETSPASPDDFGFWPGGTMES